MPANISLTELRYILAVANTLHFAKAANLCFVSQPTISIAIRKLEDNLGVKIFERNNNSIIITAIGSQILAKAQQAMAAVGEIQLLAQENKSPLALPLKLGAIHTVGPYLFPALINELITQQSNINLIIEEGYTQNLYSKLSSGELDAIIVAQPFNYPSSIIHTLYDEPLDVIVPLNHLWRNKTAIQPPELAEQTLLLLGKGNCFRDEVLQIYPQLSQYNQANSAIVTTSLETIKYMVARNLGISIMPRSSIMLDDNNLYTSIPFTAPTPQRQIIIAHRPSFSRQLVIQQLIAIIQQLKLFDS